MTGTVLAFITAASVIIGYLVISQVVGRKKQSQELTQRIATEVSMTSGDEALTSDQEPSPTAEMLDGMLMLLLPMIGRKLSTEKEALKKDFMKAGIDSPDAPTFYLFTRITMPVICTLLAMPMLLSNADGNQYLQDIMVGLILVVLGFFGPKLYLTNKIQKRTKVLQRSFPDALDLLLVCVESGLALDAALARVCNELGNAHPVITEEFNRTRLELALLNDRTKALYGLGERTDIIAFRSLAAALIQTEKFGTNLTDTLRVLADDYRQTRLLEAENKANRLPALITIPLITMLLPAFMLIVLGPAFVRVAQQGGIFGNR